MPALHPPLFESGGLVQTPATPDACGVNGSPGARIPRVQKSVYPAVLSRRMPLPFGPLRYLYVGSKDVPRDVAYYRDALGGELLWWFEDFGTQVAAMRVSAGPDVLLAGHREAPSVLPVFQVDNLKASVRGLKARGWNKKEGPFGIPDGDCYTFEDPSGNELAFFEETRPDAMPNAYKDRENRHAVEPDGQRRGADS